MRIVLVNPPYINFEGIKESAGHTTPLNLLYLASYVRSHTECQISILDSEALGLSYPDIQARLEESNPDVVGITCPTPPMKHVVKIAEIAKTVNRDCTVVVGGCHPTALPEQTARTPNIDFVVIGEGEITLLDLINALASRATEFNHIVGLAYRSDGEVILTGPRAPIGNLDDLPFPARDLLDLRLYHSPPTKRVSSGGHSTSMLSSRGCPYNCVHCVSNVMWKRKHRMRSPNNVVDEIEECVRKYGLTEFNFADDIFTLSKERVINICEEIERRKLDISWICLARVDSISRDMVSAMRKAGCKRLSFGIESGSRDILMTMRKGTDLDQISHAVKTVKECGLEVHAGFMLGNVGETRETVSQTIRFAKKLDVDYAVFFLTTPYPGTDLYELALEKGYVTEESKWEDFAPLTKSAPPLVQDNLTQSELLELQKSAFRAFYLRPRFMLRRLLKIRSLQDIRSLIEGVTIFLGIQSR